MGLTAYIYTYLIGGVTFLPLLVVVFIYLHPRVSESGDSKPSSHALLTPDSDLKAGEIEEDLESGLDTYKTGWITVTQEYLESVEDISASTQTIAESSLNKSAYSSLYKLVKNSDTVVPNNDTESSLGSGTGALAGENTDKTELHSPTASPKANTNQKRHHYYAVLKHGNLFLYKNETLKDIKHVIVLSNHIVLMWPKGVTDAQLFIKSSAIVIMKKNWSRSRRLSDQVNGDEFEQTSNRVDITDVLNPETTLGPPPGSFFIYCDTNSEKEDWYFTLIRATKSDSDGVFDPNVYARTSHFETQNMINLIQMLYSSEGQLHTKWLNAFIGRMFLSLQKTEFLRNYLEKRVYKKLNKMKTPGFLDKFQITKLEPGNSAPLITFPSLKEINPNGELLLSAHIHYFGSMKLQLATKLNLNLGARFKGREVDVLLSITIVKVQGPMLIRVKPPPSNRVWYTFEHEPVMNLKIEPIVSSRQLTYNIITNTIERKLKDAIRESLVLPHWDDFAFYDTLNEIYRGGLWDKSARQSTPEEAPVDTETFSSFQELDHADNVSVTSKSSDVALVKAPSVAKLKISSTLNDFSKKLKKPKTTSAIDSVSITKDAFGNTTEEKIEAKSGDKKISTLKKIGKWYFKDDGTTNPDYTPPEMILNRRRKSSVSTSPVNREEVQPETPSYDFGSKFSSTGYLVSGHARQMAELEDEDDDGTSEKTDLAAGDSPELTGLGVKHDEIEHQDPFLDKIPPENDLEPKELIVSGLTMNLSEDLVVASLKLKAATEVSTSRLHRKPPPDAEFSQ